MLPDCSDIVLMHSDIARKASCGDLNDIPLG